MTILIDTREQLPYQFAGSTERVTLDCGDYSLRGLEHLVCVERKSLPDLLTCIGRERERFTRELQRLRSYRFRCLVVEASAADLAAGDWRSRLKPAHVFGALAAWTARYALPVWLAGDRAGGQEFVERFLRAAARTVASECEAAVEQSTAVA